jgi:hypothetical protein
LLLLRLKGGLGNQLFQLGAALRMARGNTKSILLDVSSYAERDGIKLPCVLQGDFEFQYCLSSELITHHGGYPVYRISDNEASPFLDQTHLDAAVDLSKTHVVLDGYFQSGKNIATLKSHFRTQLDLVVPSARAPMSPLEREVVIHYRQGDYFRRDVQATLGLIKLTYVDQLISEYVKAGVGIKIYTDELGLLERYQDNLHVTLKELMSANILCVPNSSFSVAAAWLSNRIQLLIRPARWSRKYESDQITDDFPYPVRRVNNWFY